MRVAQIAPIQFQLFFIELISFEFLRQEHLRQGGAIHLKLQSTISIDYWPCVLVPSHGSEECFTPHDMLQITMRTIAKANHPPRTIWRVYQVSVPYALYRAVLHLVREVRQYGIGRARRVRTVQEAAARDGNVMAVLCSALGKH